jgi:hypothetical protein
MAGGGGVGFYICDNLKYKVINELSTFIDNEFESLTVEIMFNRKKIILSNYYRPPQANNDSFLLNLNRHLGSLYHHNVNTYVFSDTNINLLKLPNSNLAKEYLDVVHSNGFLQLISKATRIHNNAYSLIDHILCKNFQPELKTGTILLDISDHFMNFLSLPLQCNSNNAKTKSKSSRIFSLPNLTSFKNDLGALTWNDVITLNDVDACFNIFWDNFSTLYDLHFPLTNHNFNKNKCSKHDFMTTGLLISRTRKIELHKMSIINPTLYLNNYRTYRNMYNSLIRASKKLHYDAKFALFAKNPKKIWNLLNEITGNNKNSSGANISHINDNGTNISSPPDIANAFNSFFVKAGQNISESVPPSSRTPESYFPPTIDPPPNLEFGNINLWHVSDIIKSFPNKQSLDIDGISLKLLKFVRYEVSIPLAHIFNLSFTTGIFPSKLKPTERCQFSRVVTRVSVIITVPYP